MAKFNLSRYRQLLAKNDSLNKKNKDLLYKPDFIELLSCQGSVETQIFYNQKDKYFDLIKEYLVETIPSNVFRVRFTRMAREDMKKADEILNDFQQLSNFWIDSELDEFSSLFEEINEKCLYAVEFEGEDGAMPEDEFRDSIEKIFSQMQKYFDE